MYKINRINILYFGNVQNIEENLCCLSYLGEVDNFQNRLIVIFKSLLVVLEKVLVWRGAEIFWVGSYVNLNLRIEIIDYSFLIEINFIKGEKHFVNR